MLLHGDFEAASVLKLREVGADVWVKSPKTQPICFSFAIDDDPVETLVFGNFRHKTTPNAMQRLRDAITQPSMQFHAWNAPFEWLMWNTHMVRKGFPWLPIEKFHCSMAAAACAALPMSLEDVGPALNLTRRKDAAGHALMLRMARPRSLDPIVWWHDVDEQKLDRLIAYNRADVEAEREVHHAIPRMTVRERFIWLIDQRMNQRGLPVDLDLVTRLQRLTDTEIERIDDEIEQVTNGEITTTRQNQRLLKWLQGHGYPYDTLERDKLEELVTGLDELKLMTPDLRALVLRHEASKTSTAKLRSIASYAQGDGHARYLTQYGGAQRTLRWAGRGPQIQNFPRPLIENVDAAIDAIKLGLDPEGIRLLFGRPLDVVSSCLRGVFCARKGAKLVVCDFAQIEARVIAWLAGHTALLDIFRKGEDVYLYTAQQIGSDNRQFGKVLVLACGFGMGYLRFVETARGYGLILTEAEADQGVTAWRQANRPIVSMWHAYQDAATNVIDVPGLHKQCGRVTFRMADPTRKLRGSLLIALPSGRNLVYRNARIEDGRIRYDGVNQYTRKWETLDTYGGKLVENVTQAVARDLLAEALIELHYDEDLRVTVHDEIVAMAPVNTAEPLYRRMRAVMRTAPDWAPGLPLDAKGYIGDRYKKG